MKTLKLIAAAAVVALGAQAASAQEKFITIGTGGQTGVYFVVGQSIGGVVPLLLKRFGQDPAVASGPLLTTITDMAGFFLVLSLASAMMPLLV